MRKRLVALLLITCVSALPAHADEFLQIQGQQFHMKTEFGHFVLARVGGLERKPGAGLSRKTLLDHADTVAQGLREHLFRADGTMAFKRTRVDDRDSTVQVRYRQMSRGFWVHTQHLDLTLGADGVVLSGYAALDTAAIPVFRALPESKVVAACRAAVPGSPTLIVRDSTWSIKRFENGTYRLVAHLLFEDATPRAFHGWDVEVDATSGEVIRAESSARD